MRSTIHNEKPPLAIEFLRTGTLRANPSNPRTHTEKQIHQIAQSIRTFGFNVPILVDSDLSIIAGHARTDAAKLLKLAIVPVIRLAHLTEEQKRAFEIADNRLSEVASWDSRLLGEQLKFLSEAEINFSLETTGFEIGEIDLFIEGLSQSTTDNPDEADILPSEEGLPSVTHAGNCWLLGKHRVLCGDAREVSHYRQLMSGRKAAVVFTDPPYNVRIDGHATGNGRIQYREFAVASGEMDSREFTEFLEDALGCAAKHSVAGALHFVFMDWRHMGELLTAGNEVYDELKNLCVWAKNRAGMGSLYRSQHELIFVFKKGRAKHRNNVQLGALGRFRTNLWQYPAIGSFGKSTSEGDLTQLHPTVKPVALVADAILDCSARGDIILDPFLGSGTTVIAADRVGRVCYGLEIDPLYVDTIVRRWEKFTKKQAVHEASGREFREMEENCNVA
jgi:DNA modification methylase